MNSLIAVILVGALLSSLFLATPKPKPKRRSLDRIDWSKVVH